VTPNGTAIRALRTALKLGIRVVEQRTGLDRSFLSRLERGERGATEDQLRAIARAMDVPVAAINREEQS
jgi:transcriptional regulator with XRE-family HTH domain